MRDSLLTSTQKAEFEKELLNFQCKKETAAGFLQHVLDPYQNKTAAKCDESDWALFLCLVIVLLQHRPLRVSLHERALTVKKQLEEGVKAR